jgi:hypothetical protein
VVLGASTFNSITGATSTVTLLNLNNTLRGGGSISGLKLSNGASGVIEQTGALALTIDTGTNAVTNNGLIESAGTGGLTVASAVIDNGTLQALAGTLALAGQVSGTGKAVVNGGRLVFDAADTFKGGATIKSGVLELAVANGAGAGSITFAPPAGAAATLVLDTGATPFTAGVATFATPLVNFGAGGFIDIAGLTFAAGATVSLAGAVMTVSSGGKTVKFTLAGALPTQLLVVAGPSGGVQINTEGLSTQGELAAAVNAANQTPAGAGPIKLLICGNIELDQALSTIDLAAGVSLDFEGSGLSVDGPAAGLVIAGGQVSMENWTFAGPLSVGKGASFSGNGTIGGAVVDNGQIEAIGGALTLAGPVSGAGGLLIAKGADLILGAGAGQGIDFAAGGGRLTLDEPGKVTGLIRDFTTGDVIDLAGIKATRLRRDGALLDIYAGTRLVAALDIASSGKTAFALAADGAGGTQITVGPLTQSGPPPATPISTPDAGGTTAQAGSLFAQSAAGHLVSPGRLDGLSRAADLTVHPTLLARP